MEKGKKRELVVTALLNNLQSGLKMGEGTDDLHEDPTPHSLQQQQNLPPGFVCSDCKEVIKSLALSVPLDSTASYHRFVSSPSPCNFHSKLLQWLHPAQNCDTKIQGVIHSSRSPYISVRVMEGHRDDSVVLVKKSLGMMNIGIGRVCDPLWIDNGIIQQWKRRCDTEHGIHCGYTLASERLLPPRLVLLIDVRRQCLVEASGDERYVALSYVWGQREMLQTRKSNVQELKQENAFLKDRFSDLIACTIRDAIGLTLMLGEEHLWVDALCIMQDDEATKHSLIDNMSTIYAHATLTIVAADGEDASHGLRGLRNISNSRNFRQNSVKVGDLYHLIQSNSYYIGDKAWSSRGWTLQEGLLSPRYLVFANESVFWSCGSVRWEEEIDYDSQPNSILSGSFDFLPMLTTMFPRIRHLNRLVSDYNTRRLTFEEDILKAFSGLSTVLNHTYIGGFLQGMPVMFFDAALLWSNKLYTKVYRRTWANDAVHCPPSWSWAGWNGSINGDSWEGADDYIAEDHKSCDKYWKCPFLTSPMVEWFIRGTKESQPKSLPYQNCWVKHRKLCTIGSSSPPLGWTRHPIRGQSPTPPKLWRSDPKRPSYYYVHESDPSVKFWYPIPLKSAQDDLNPECVGQYISCQTQRAYFWRDWERSPLGTHETRWSEQNIVLPFELMDGTRSPAGEVQLHVSTPTDFQPENSKAGESLAIEDAYEMVAISKGLEDKLVEVPGMLQRKLELYSFVNVLCVEWVDGIAYRKGLGRIAQEVWGRQELETIELILG